MKHCIIWRDGNPCIVSFLRGMELDMEVYTSLPEAFRRMAELGLL